MMLFESKLVIRSVLGQLYYLQKQWNLEPCCPRRRPTVELNMKSLSSGHRVIIIKRMHPHGSLKPKIIGNHPQGNMNIHV